MLCPPHSIWPEDKKFIIFPRMEFCQLKLKKPVTRTFLVALSYIVIYSNCFNPVIVRISLFKIKSFERFEIHGLTLSFFYCQKILVFFKSCATVCNLILKIILFTSRLKLKRFAGEWLLFAEKSNSRNIKNKWNL